MSCKSCHVLISLWYTVCIIRATCLAHVWNMIFRRTKRTNYQKIKACGWVMSYVRFSDIREQIWWLSRQAMLFYYKVLPFVFLGSWPVGLWIHLPITWMSPLNCHLRSCNSPLNKKCQRWRQHMQCLFSLLQRRTWSYAVSLHVCSIAWCNGLAKPLPVWALAVIASEQAKVSVSCDLHGQMG